MIKIIQTAFYAVIVIFVLLNQAKGQDLYGISKYDTDSGNVEVNTLAHAGNYQEYLNQVITPWPSVGPNSPWSYTIADIDADGIPDLVGILWNSSSDLVELHVLSGASNYQQSIDDVATPLYTSTQNASDFIFVMADTDQDGKPDLVAIKLYNTSNLEVHVLSGSSNYQQWIDHVATPIPAPGLNSGLFYSMADIDGDGKPDLVRVLYNTSSQLIEVHVLSGASNYQQSIDDVATPLSASPDVSNFTFAMGDLDHDGKPDLVGIAEYGTGTGKVEVHALSGASNYQQWIDHVGTAFPATSNPSNVAFSIATVTRGVVGISSLAYIDESHISTYSATEVDYETAAYYDTYVEACLYQDGSAIACGNQISAPGSSTADGYLNIGITAGPHYQLQANHYLVAPFAYVSAGVNYYYNPYGFGYASDGGDYSIDGSYYWTAGAAVYIGYADIYLGSTGLDAYTPLTEFNRGDLQGAVIGAQYNGDGSYSLVLNGPGWEIGYQDNFIGTTDVLKTGACISEPELCAVVAGGSAVVIYVAPKLGNLIQDIWQQWHARQPFPYPYPGNDPTIAPGPDWTWKGSGPPQSGKGRWVKNGTKESLHPDLQHAPPIGPHWDYVDGNGKEWRVWPDGTMSKK